MGNCGITDLDELPELFECTHLKTLILSNEWLDAETGMLKKRKNRGEANRLKSCSSGLLKLEKLNTLVAAGDTFNKWELSDAYHLAGLTHLKSLDLSYHKNADYCFWPDPLLFDLFHRIPARIEYVVFQI